MFVGRIYIHKYKICQYEKGCLKKLDNCRVFFSFLTSKLHYRINSSLAIILKVKIGIQYHNYLNYIIWSSLSQKLYSAIGNQAHSNTLDCKNYIEHLRLPSHKVNNDFGTFNIVAECIKHDNP